KHTMTDEVYTIYEAPLPPQHPEELAQPPPQLTLAEAHQTLFDEVLKHFDRDDYVIPGVEDGALLEAEKFWLVSVNSAVQWVNRRYILKKRGHKYLRATKWASAHAAIKRLEETLVWRREYGVYDIITASHVEPEAVTGKMVIFGYDVEGRPALYLRPSRQNTSESIRQVQFVVYFLELLPDLMGPGVETLALMVDFADRAKNPSLGQARTVLNILQTHYPERLGRAFVINLPFLVNAFFRLIMPFIDPMTRPKLRFNPSCIAEGLFTPDQLLREWGGSQHFEYEHERYWGALLRLCAERREAMWEAWRAKGAKVGVKEWEVKRAAGLGGEESVKISQPTPLEPEKVAVAENGVQQNGTASEPLLEAEEPEEQGQDGKKDGEEDTRTSGEPEAKVD
ncbi:CRAL-TRIO domain-containing protein C23B6.04c, partial [Grifola frondosa]